jgi:hypothetical protein
MTYEMWQATPFVPPEDMRTSDAGTLARALAETWLGPGKYVLVCRDDDEVQIVEEFEVTVE